MIKRGCLTQRSIDSGTNLITHFNFTRTKHTMVQMVISGLGAVSHLKM